MNVPVAHSSESVIQFFAVMHKDVPWRVDNDFLLSHGFKSGNHTELRGIFKSLRFLDETGAPTKRWHDYRDSDDKSAKEVLQIAIREAYDELFAAFPEAYKQNNQELTAWLREHKDYSPITAIRAVRTFKRLCDFAGFVEKEPSVPNKTELSRAPFATDSSSTDFEALSLLAKRVVSATDEFLRATLQNAVDQGIITVRQREEVLDMHTKDGLHRSS